MRRLEPQGRLTSPRHVPRASDVGACQSASLLQHACSGLSAAGSMAGCKHSICGLMTEPTPTGTLRNSLLKRTSVTARLLCSPSGRSSSWS